jgi:hypothetical protein
LQATRVNKPPGETGAKIKRAKLYGKQETGRTFEP